MEVLIIAGGLLVFGLTIFWLRWEALRSAKAKIAKDEARRGKHVARNQVEFVLTASPADLQAALLAALDLPLTSVTRPDGGLRLASADDEGVAIALDAPEGAGEPFRAAVRWEWTDSGRLAGTYAHLRVADDAGVPADVELLAGLQRTVLEAIAAADPDARTVVETVPPQSPSPAPPERALARAADPLTTAAELAEIAYHVPEARAAVAAHPAIHPALVAWLVDRGDPDVDRALAARDSA